MYQDSSTNPHCNALFPYPSALSYNSYMCYDSTVMQVLDRMKHYYQ